MYHSKLTNLLHSSSSTSHTTLGFRFPSFSRETNMMTMSATMQSFVAVPVTRGTNRVRVNQLLHATYVPRLARRGHMTVRCMAEEEKVELNATPTPSPPKPDPIPFKSSPKPKVSTKFSDVLAFSGPAPERINGRLAMIGFVAAMAVEVASGEDVFAQISNGGVPWFIVSSVVLSLASLIPLFQGVSVESKSKGFMTADAEMWNGRFAMLGLVALALTEYVKGGTLV